MSSNHPHLNRASNQASKTALSTLTADPAAAGTVVPAPASTSYAADPAAGHHFRAPVARAWLTGHAWCLAILGFVFVCVSPRIYAATDLSAPDSWPETTPICDSLSPDLQQLGDGYFDLDRLAGPAPAGPVSARNADADTRKLRATDDRWRGTVTEIECFGAGQQLSQQQDTYRVISARTVLSQTTVLSTNEPARSATDRRYKTHPLSIRAELTHTRRDTSGYRDKKIVRQRPTSKQIDWVLTIPEPSGQNPMRDGPTAVRYWNTLTRSGTLSSQANRGTHLRESRYWMQLQSERLQVVIHQYVNGHFAAARELELQRHN